MKVPTDLQARSRAAKHFHTLKALESKADLSEALKIIEVYKAAAINIEYALERLRKEGANDSSAAEIWTDLAAQDKAALFDIRTKRVVKDMAITLGEANLDEIVNNFLRNSDAQGNLVGNNPMPAPIRQALEETLKLAARMELHPTRDQLVNIMTEDLMGLKAAASECASFETEVKALLSDAEADEGSRIIWKVDATVFNTGRSPESLFSIGALSIQKPAQGNIAIVLRDESINKFIVPPGDAVDIVLSSTEANPDLDSSLINLYKSGDRDCIVSLQKINGEYVLSDKYNFTDEVDQGTQDELLKYASDLSI